MFQSYDPKNCKDFLKFGENLVKKNYTFMDSVNKLIDTYQILTQVRTEILSEKNIDSSRITCAIDIYLFMDYIESMKNFGADLFTKDKFMNVYVYLYIKAVADYYKSIYFFEQKAMSVQLSKLAYDIRESMKAYTGTSHDHPVIDLQIPFHLYAGMYHLLL